jgi:hypothetical protein
MGLSVLKVFAGAQKVVQLGKGCKRLEYCSKIMFEQGAAAPMDTSSSILINTVDDTDTSGDTRNTRSAWGAMSIINAVKTIPSAFATVVKTVSSVNLLPSSVSSSIGSFLETHSATTTLFVKASKGGDSDDEVSTSSPGSPKDGNDKHASLTNVTCDDSDEMLEA